MDTNKFNNRHLNLFETHFISSNIGFVVGENSAFLKTTDGGINWSSVYGGGGQTKGVFFTTLSKGYKVGNYVGNGIIEETSDGGITWNVVINNVSNLNNIMFPSQNVGYAVGDNGTILKLHQFVTGTYVLTGCDSLTWIDGNTYYSDNNTAMFNIVNGASNGYDSLVTLNLTINNSSTGIDTQTACNSYIWIDGNTYTSSTNIPTYTLTNAAGCDSVITLNLTINTVDVSVTVNSPDLTANATGVTYQWLDCNNGNAVISGATNQSFTATTNGSYAVEITDNNCIDTSTCFNIASIDINELNNNIEIFPNPAGEFVSILTNNLIASSISIVNIQGTVVWNTNNVQSNKYIIDLSNFSNGIYFIRLKTDNSIINKKIIIKK